MGAVVRLPAARVQPVYAPAVPRSPAPAAPSADALPACVPLPGSSQPRTRIPCESAQTAPLSFSAPSPASRLFGRMLGQAGWGQLTVSKGAVSPYRNHIE